MRVASTIPVLSEDSFACGVRRLVEADPALAAVQRRWGDPPFWSRPPGFPTLIHIILEQQVSLASALAAFRRVSEMAAPLAPASFLALDDNQLRVAGFSRQKAAYGRELARTLLDGELDLDALQDLDDDMARACLLRVKGIGPWSAEIYLLMALRRPDVWPLGDLALAAAVQDVTGLDHRPDRSELEQIGERWRPWRAVAARLLWHHYLSKGRPSSGEQ